MKDPAFLFYTSDFLTGTLTMTDEQVGKYIRLLCLQHQKGRLAEKDMLFICKSYDEDIFSKFEQNGDGRYFNRRLENETDRRKKYSESRSTNRKSGKKNTEKPEEKAEDKKNICKSYDEHMETETENCICSSDSNINISSSIITTGEKFDYSILKGNHQRIESWYRATVTANGLTVDFDRFTSLLDKFCQRQESLAKPYKNINDYVDHFVNWVEIQVKKPENQKERRRMP